MGFKNLAMAYALHNILKSKAVDKKVDEIVDGIDSLADTNLKRNSEKIQKQIVTNILLPVCSGLLKEDPNTLLGVCNDWKAEIEKRIEDKLQR